MKSTVVNARGFSGFSASLHPAGPKFAIQCGACPATFRERVPVVEYPTVKCPECGAFNRLDVVPA